MKESMVNLFLGRALGRALFCGALATMLASHASATTLRVATWNLGWHVSQAELAPWMAQCGKSFARNAQSGVWEVVPAQAPGARVGWAIDESRPTLEGVDLAVMPPCGVYRSPGRESIAVTPAAWAKRTEQIAKLLRDEVRADVIAFQEVSGVAAVREALGPAAADYEVCSFSAYKVQRLAFAWRKSLGASVGPCQDIRELSLLHLPPKDQVRPGLALTLQLAGRKIRFLTVHLKSGCVSPLNRGRLDGSTGPEDPCPVLQQQVGPLEAAVEELSKGVDHLVVLGDFNRNLGHEAARVKGAEPVRSDGGTDLARARPAGVLTRNLLMELNDGRPASSRLALVPPTCSGSPEVSAACDAAKLRLLNQDERRTLTDRTGLGCRNPIGLDHIRVSEGLAKSATATKLPLGNLGRALPPKPPQNPEPLLAVSDHCPLVAEVDL
ncbi:MAG: endonuclease/exonuclease/phosphatase family protein [Pseudomonadota bacterium]